MQTFTFTAWQSIRLGPYRQAEYACDYYYKDGKCVGSSNCYYTGRYRWTTHRLTEIVRLATA